MTDDMPLGYSISLVNLNGSDSGLGQSMPLDPNSNSDTVDVVLHHRGESSQGFGFHDQRPVFSSDFSRMEIAENEGMANLSDIYGCEITEYHGMVDLYDVSGCEMTENEGMADASDVDFFVSYD